MPSSFATGSTSFSAKSALRTTLPSLSVSHFASPENKCKVMVPPSTVEFLAGSIVAGSEAMQTEIVSASCLDLLLDLPPQAASPNTITKARADTRAFFMCCFFMIFLLFNKMFYSKDIVLNQQMIHRLINLLNSVTCDKMSLLNFLEFRNLLSTYWLCMLTPCSEWAS